MHGDQDPGIPPALLLADPGLPQPNPTVSYWQWVPHDLADVQSPSLPQRTDVAVIGSGITGLSVTKTILERRSSAHITVLEARSLCSGATGRNGGQLAANAGEEYMLLVHAHGREMAGRIVNFTFRNIQKMQELIEGVKGDSEYQQVTKLRVFLTTDVFETFKESIAQMEEDHPSLRGMYTLIDAETVLNKYGIHGAAGGCILPAGTVWPYRVVTQVFSALLAKYSRRLAIETNTPVTSVAYDPSPNQSHPYIVQTNRGSLPASQVAHCTNGHTGHLLPGIRGMDPAGQVRNQGHSLSWGIHYPPRYDSGSEKYAYGLYYLAQSAKTGYFYFGGENARFQDCLTADDTTTGPGFVGHLRQVLPRLFGKGNEYPWSVVSSWSGIMGFSADGLPVVGRLPAKVTRRGGDGEWIAAAFNGYGMANCLLSGEALALMMLGEDVSERLPDAYSADLRRFEKTVPDQRPVKSVL